MTVTPAGEHDPTGAASTGGTHLPSAVTGAAATAPGHQDMFGATFGGDTSGFGGLVPRRVAEVSSPRGAWLARIFFT